MRFLLRLAALLAVLSVAAVAARIGFNFLLKAPGPSAEAAILVFPKGTRTAEIGAILGKAGVIGHPGWWAFEARLSGRQPLVAGEYAFPAHASLATIFDMMRHGQVVEHKLTVAEGLTVFQVQAVLRQAIGLAGRSDASPAEGSLLPATYFYRYGDDKTEMVARMQRGMTELVDELWQGRSPTVGLADKGQALTLASIVERETGVPEERAHIAAVFLNRLRQHMRLQSDPTVIYGLSHGEGVLDRPLAHADLANADPYNTYAVDGLPTGPICNPGRASIMAVLHPAQSDDLYFVADRSGGHVFAKSLADHNKNVGKLRGVEQGTEPAPIVKKAKSAK